MTRKDISQPDMFGQAKPAAIPASGDAAPRNSGKAIAKKTTTSPTKKQAAMNSPEKNPEAFKTISEVAELIDVPQHVLRFWETKFKQIKPLKLRGGRRYYRPQDVDAISLIKKLLYQDGYTIKGAKKAFEQARRSQGSSPVFAQPQSILVAHALSPQEQKASEQQKASSAPPKIKVPEAIASKPIEKTSPAPVSKAIPPEPVPVSAKAEGESRTKGRLMAARAELLELREAIQRMQAMRV